MSVENIKVDSSNSLCAITVFDLWIDDNYTDLK